MSWIGKDGGQQGRGLIWTGRGGEVGVSKGEMTKRVGDKNFKLFFLSPVFGDVYWGGNRRD